MAIGINRAGAPETPTFSLTGSNHELEAFDSYSIGWLSGLLAALLATGAFAGLLAGLLGVGGGIVVVPVLYHLFTLLGIDEAVKMHVTVGTSLATIIPTSIMSARAHALRGSLDFELLRALGPGLLLGVALGAWISGLLKGPTLTAIFASVALLVAINMAFARTPKAITSGLPKAPVKQLIAAAIGGISTLMGIGGGTLSVPILSLFNYPIHRAVGTAAAIGMIISVPGAAGFIVNGLGEAGRPPASLGYVNLLAVAAIVPASMLTAPLGARLAHAINAERLRQIFALFLLLTAARMLYGLAA